MDKKSLMQFGVAVLAVVVGLQVNNFVNVQMMKAKTSAPKSE